MYATEFEKFRETLNDLCSSVNRPCNDELVRVFWEDLRGFHLSDVQQRTKLLRATGKRQFTSHDLRPEKEPDPVATGPGDHERLDACFRAMYPNASPFGRTFRGERDPHRFTSLEGFNGDERVRVTMDDVLTFEANRSAWTTHRPRDSVEFGSALKGMAK